MTMLSMVERAILKSLRLAPSTATPMGTPAPSVSRLRLTPRLPRSVGFLPVFFPPEGCLGHAPVHRQPGPVDPLQLVVRQQPGLPEPQEHAGGDPLLEPVVGRGPRADAGGVQGLPLAPGPQPEEDGVGARPVGLARPPASEPVGVRAAAAGSWPTAHRTPATGRRSWF